MEEYAHSNHSFNKYTSNERVYSGCAKNYQSHYLYPPAKWFKVFESSYGICSSARRKTKNHRGTIMSLIVYKRPIIQFNLYTTKPFHSRKSAIDFLRWIRSYGPYYLPIKYDFFEPIKQIFNSNDEKCSHMVWWP